MDGSPMKKLAAELRNQIYELAISHPAAIHLRQDPSGSALAIAQPADKRHRVTLSLQATCKQFRDECTTMFYPLNDFVITTHPAATKGDRTHYLLAMQDFVASIGLENAKMARSLSFKVTRGTAQYVSSSTIGPAITQLYPWCKSVGLPLKVEIFEEISAKLDMLDLRASCAVMLREMEGFAGAQRQLFAWPSSGCAVALSLNEEGMYASGEE
ncbi:hypothetical protein B0A55_00169 [Friedmanniomyces simplex]|uniref:Uncharacterized protein n=1 Tax=Friedmanniomyces simplex TaxID=329884 RepID=A0A4U0Y0I7_9PEZI|nr:hypothetical protein B0A55_00169 [Friedmanniomyces simplex]